MKIRKTKKNTKRTVWGAKTQRNLWTQNETDAQTTKTENYQTKNERRSHHGNRTPQKANSWERRTEETTSFNREGTIKRILALGLTPIKMETHQAERNSVRKSLIFRCPNQSQRLSWTNQRGNRARIKNY